MLSHKNQFVIELVSFTISIFLLLERKANILFKLLVCTRVNLNSRSATELCHVGTQGR